MEWIIIILVILAVVLVAALVWSAMKRKKDQVGRERAGELRSEAATTAAAKHEQEAQAREAEAEAERVRAQADKLDARAQEQRTTYDMTQAKEEDSVREADRLDPDVNHRGSEYQPDLNGTPTHRSDAREQGAQTRTASHRQSSGPANPVPSGPETIVPEDHDDPRRERF